MDGAGRRKGLGLKRVDVVESHAEFLGAACRLDEVPEDIVRVGPA